MKIVWSSIAIDRAGTIAEYIASDNPAAAQNWLNAVFAKVEILKTSSQSGRVVPETGREEIREILYGNYRIINHLGERKISVLTVRNGSQILPAEEVSA